jgi:imidazolonepropionase-like amidohydrolase
MEEIMYKRFAVAVGAAFVALTVAFTSVWYALQPPALPVPVRTAFVVKDVTLINPGLNRQDHVDIAIDHGTIRAIAPTTKATTPTDIRCDGCVVLPGLIDMHAHMPPRAAIGNDQLFALLYLANGVTMIREVGSSDGNTYSIRDAIAAGDYPGPRMISCGLVLDGVPPTRPNNFIVRTPAEGRAAVAEAVAHGARCLKMYNMLSRDVVLAIADAAAAAHLPIVAHTPHSVSLLDAPYIADVQHFTGVPETSDVEKLGRDDYINDDFANLSDARIAAVVAAALAQHTIHTPALINEDDRRTLADASRFPPDPQIAILPDFWTVVWHWIWRAPNEGPAREAVYDGFRARERALLKALFDAHATIYAGTDTLMPFVAPGAALVSEVRLFADVGITPEQALVTATTAPGQFWPDTTYGRIAQDLPADLVIYRGDPTASLKALDSIDTVIADGRIYPEPLLDVWVEQYRAHFHSALYARVMGGLVRFLAARYKPD